MGDEQRREQAEEALREWAAVHTRRDELIRAAAAAGLSTHRIHALTGIARTTIMRVLAQPPRGE
ncbi:MAG TPA: hypothetical protein VGM53_19675 [Streptosporangiaceae bacterium]|jgi:hypothetical protein